MNHTIAATPAEDEKFMKEALKQARKACRLQETPIGCVIVRTHDYDGNPITPKIIARGYNRRNTDKNPLSHAEIIAIKKAAKVLGDWRLEGCTLYVTLEPCQMCAGALIQGRIDRVVIGAMNKKAGCAGSILNLLEEPRFNHQAIVERGIMEEACGSLMTAFFKQLRKSGGRTGRREGKIDSI
ncbi:MAG: tRNA adenosine(34) deaminase TadA [Lachnospiraceae bacterium]|nr:tRNA adenosine(34) deaminase TadA [Lachnospiraceae bacterium]